ncbi:filamin-binding LIM protein 1 isoform X3 [Neopsephotus bourkii]|uniref:filamin-binding LIM protein 1 isoform X3 n=1 Tax=Neopsephotus bourkii TaxID=309878 RepID=UPI002AA59D9A|nr:filamin-binding LIM protein 1 isoform X3 [Neopsephotus bourkii]
MRPGSSSHRSGPSVLSAMLPGKAEKRMVSSVFITLVPPRREEATKEKTQRELRPDGDKVPGTHHPWTPLPRPPALPNGDICAFCHKALGPREPTVEAMGKQYHAECFTCRTCPRLLAGQRYYQKDGRPMCDACYQATLEKCAKCKGLITERIVRALGKGFHPDCFSCAACGRAIGAESFAVDEQDEVYCVADFYRKYAAVCSACERPIIPHEDKDTYKIECLGRSFHESCYCCESCRTPLSPELTEDGCYPLDNHLLCKSCHIRWRSESSC